METLTKRLLWLYFVLIVIEGALRKWVVPGLSEPLLIIRDPVALGIYAFALMSGRFPFRGAIFVLVVLAMLSAVFAAIAGAPPFVALYGVRINYFHVPLIFIMADLLTRKDVLAFGRAVLWLSLPIGALMIAQFQAGEFSRLNVGAGGDIGGQLSGALGKIRPPGPFSFITGPILWFSLATAFTCYGWLNRGVYPRLLLIAVTCMTLVVIPISISRMLLFSVLAVIAFGAVAVLRNPRRGLAVLAPGLLAMAVFGVLGEGELTDAFKQRWTTSTSSGLQESVVLRFFNDYLGGLDLVSSAPLTGHGIGMGSNVGARFSTGRMGFQLAESEWAKIVLELGPILGFAFIAFRCWLSARLLFAGWQSLLVKEDSLPWLLCGACILPVISGQWAPPTILGFAVFGAGLAFAAANTDPEIDEEEEAEDDSDENDENGEEDGDKNPEVPAPEEDLPQPRRRIRRA